MHFFYLDEAGCNLRDLQNDEAPIFVLGGIIVKDKGWNKTHGDFETIINRYFNNAVPDNFELHSHELLSPNGDGHFAGHDRARRNQLAIDLYLSHRHKFSKCKTYTFFFFPIPNTFVHFQV